MKYAEIPEKNLSKDCQPGEIALKGFFLGPQAENAQWLKAQVTETLDHWFKWRKSVYPDDGRAISTADQYSLEFLERRAQFEDIFLRLQCRFEAEVPKFSPRYIAHMFSEMSLPALLGHLLTLLHNPNNISGESSRVGVKIEDEAIDFLSQMLGMSTEEGWGHFTSGGTLANIEGLLRARNRLDRWLSLAAYLALHEDTEFTLFDAAHMGWERYDRYISDFSLKQDQLKPFSTVYNNPFAVAAHYQRAFHSLYTGPVVLIPNNKHYSWQKAVTLLGMSEEAFWPVDIDPCGKLNVTHLKERIEDARAAGRPIAAVISVAGTTELGELDPIDRVQNLLDEYTHNENIHIWHHVDAAYGGFFCSLLRHTDDRLLPLSTENIRALQAIATVNSVTLDPHKLGYVPYASGTFLTRLKREYFLMSIDAPYLELKPEQDKGPQTIEGSRSATGAVATWLTAKTIGLDGDGYGRILERTIRSRQVFEEVLSSNIEYVHIAPGCETNVLCFCIAKIGEPLSVTNARTQSIYDAFSPGQDNPFFVSKTSLNWKNYSPYLDAFTQRWNAERDRDELTLIRLCLMNPFISSREMQVDFPREFALMLKDVVQ